MTLVSKRLDDVALSFVKYKHPLNGFTHLKRISDSNMYFSHGYEC